MFSIWPKCENCEHTYELSEYELNQTSEIPRILFCSECHHTFVVTPEEVQKIRDILEQSPTEPDIWEEMWDDESVVWQPVSPDHLEAARLEQLAEDGNTMAMLVLGALYCEGGFGLHRDLEQARYWWEKAHEHGESEALDCLEQLAEKSGEACPEFTLPPHWFALREIQYNQELPIEFNDDALELLLRIDERLFGHVNFEGSHPDTIQENLQKQDQIIYQALRQALPQHCQDCYTQLLKVQYDLEFSLLIQDFTEANRIGEKKLQYQEHLRELVEARHQLISITPDHIDQGLAWLGISFQD